MSTTPHFNGGSGSRRHSRRSTGGSINFAQMSISPLTSTDITEYHFTKKSSSHGKPRSKTPTRTRSYYHKSSSYLQGLSAPPTPGILTPSAFIPISAGPHSHTHPSSMGTHIPRSKSSTHLHRKTSSTSSDWLHRTGLALTYDARENKGQSWLTTRDSSTSLKLEGSDSEEDNNLHSVGISDGEEEEDDEEGDVFEDARSVRSVRSARSVRSGRNTPGLVRRSVEEQQRREEVVASWVLEEGGDEEEEVYSEDEEFTKRQAFKVGQFIDRWIGWRIFGEVDEEEEEDEELEEGGKRKRQTAVQEVKERVPLDEETLRRLREKREEGTDDWKDPAWVLSLISNLVF